MTLPRAVLHCKRAGALHHFSFSQSGFRVAAGPRAGRRHLETHRFTSSATGGGRYIKTESASPRGESTGDPLHTGSAHGHASVDHATPATHESSRKVHAPSDLVLETGAVGYARQLAQEGHGGWRLRYCGGLLIRVSIPARSTPWLNMWAYNSKHVDQRKARKA